MSYSPLIYFAIKCIYSVLYSSRRCGRIRIRFKIFIAYIQNISSIWEVINECSLSLISFANTLTILPMQSFLIIECTFANLRPCLNYSSFFKDSIIKDSLIKFVSRSFFKKHSFTLKSGSVHLSVISIFFRKFAGSSRTAIQFDCLQLILFNVVCHSGCKQFEKGSPLFLKLWILLK